VGDVVISLQRQIPTSSAATGGFGRVSLTPGGNYRDIREESVDEPDSDRARRSTWAGHSSHRPGDAETNTESPTETRASRQSVSNSREARLHPHPTIQPGSVRLNGLTYNQAMQMTSHSRSLRGAGGGAIYHFIGERKASSQAQESTGAPATGSLWPFTSSEGGGCNSPSPSVSSSRGGDRAEAWLLPRFSCVFDGNRLAEAMSLPNGSTAGTGRRRASRPSSSALASFSSTHLQMYLSSSLVDALGLFVWACPLTPSLARSSSASVSGGGGGRSRTNSIDGKSDSGDVLCYFLPQVSLV
jgi:hypothetical protein